jgi:alpha-L-fucosidase
MKMKTEILLLAALLTITTNVVADPDPNFYIFLCFGQSNMEGFPGIEEHDKTGVDDRFQVLATVDFPDMDRTKGNWYKAVPPLCRGNTGLCPADYFGRTLVANLPENIRVGVVNVSVAGCKIELFDEENYQAYAATAPSWMTNIIKQYDGNPYQYLVDMAKLAQKDGVIKGILLHQGESNTNDKKWPDKVKGIYDNLINDLNLKAEEVPLLAGELVNADQEGACASMNAIIAELPQTIPNSYVVSSKGCISRPDHLHFTPAGYRELGERYGKKMLSLVGYKIPNFKPTFESLEKVNPVPEWFKDAKFGIYFHWGVYSVPAFSNEWYPRNMYIKGSPENKHHIEIYGDPSQWPYNYFITGAKDRKGNFVQFTPKLKSEGGKFDPEEWAQLFADAGAKFAGPVAEHHDGFSMWASKVNPWNAKDMGPKLDLVGLLTDTIRKKNMRVILSMHHAYNITGYYDAVPKTNDPKLQLLYGQQGKEKNEAFWLNKHKEIIDNYKPDIIWQDFNLHVISKSVLLEFLSYYYNQAAVWDKEVVATYKDGLNTKCAVLDYERGGPADITDNYWLTDDAISSSSWCYTEGLGYYSKKQILHGFLDRISKNGNLLLNISPRADGTIPQEQKDILLTMGAWLKKYGEAVYATRAWEKYGEGPTKMGAAHGVMGAPSEGTAEDVRYTRSKNNTTLYAILLGWEDDQKEVTLKSLSSDRIDGKKLKSVELINDEAGKYLPLAYKQKSKGLIIRLPDRSFDELAYVLKLNFDGKIPTLDKFADLNCKPHYYIVPGNNRGSLILGSDLALTVKRKDISNQWKLKAAGKGIYKILNRGNNKKAIGYSDSEQELVISKVKRKYNQLWKFEEARNGSFKITNKKFPNIILSVNSPIVEGNKAEVINSENSSSFGWKLMEVCELKQEAFKPNTIPGTIEAEDFDTGCPDDAYYDRDEINEGGQYRLNEGVDIEKCSAGGFNVGWTHRGEWMAYTVTVSKSATYKISFYIASAYDSPKLHLECDGADKTGIISIPNTAGFQNWEVIKKTVKLDAGQHLLKLVVDGDYLNLDKMVLEEVKNESSGNL